MAPSWIDPALRGGSALSAGLALGLMGLLASPLQAAPKDPPYPSMDQLRELQLHTFACGRENTAESCTKARTMADPLMDHPRLGASCKDAIWTIRQRAQPAATNSFERREALNRAGQDLLPFCKQQTRTVAPSKTEAKPQEKKGFGLIPGF
jgi:plasmid stabilization system protein ParE